MQDNACTCSSFLLEAVDKCFDSCWQVAFGAGQGVDNAVALGVGEAVEVEVAFASDEAVAQEGGGEAGFGEAAGGGHLGELYLDDWLDVGLVEEVHGAVVQVVAAAQQDEGLGGEVFEVNARAAGREVASGEDVGGGQAVLRAMCGAGHILRDGEQDGVGEHGRAREILDDSLVAAEGQVDLALLEHARHGVGASLEQVELDLREPSVEARQDLWQDAGVDEVAAADGDGPRAQRADVVELVAQVLLERPRLLDGLEVDAPGGRQADGPRAAVEERHAERGFELANRDAQGGLGDEERLSCLGKTLLPVDFIDVAHILLHMHSLFHVFSMYLCLLLYQIYGAVKSINWKKYWNCGML